MGKGVTYPLTHGEDFPDGLVILFEEEEKGLCKTSSGRVHLNSLGISGWASKVGRFCLSSWGVAQPSRLKTHAPPLQLKQINFLKF